MQELLTELQAIVGSVQKALPAALGVLFFFVARWPVRARRTVTMKVGPEQAFAAVDFQSPTQAWHRAPTLIELVDETQQIYRATYWSNPSGGGGRKTTALWRIAERVPPARLVIERQGIEAAKTSGELMRIDIDIAAADGGSRLAMAYHWGPRPLIAQVLARIDLGHTLKRIKTIVETGDIDPGRERRSAVVTGVLTALASLVGLGLLFGWRMAVIVLVVLVVHELGHLVAFRLVGQPWGRIVFIPFIGAIAMPRQGFDNLGQYAFASLMGPAFSLVLLLPAIVAAQHPGDGAQLMLDVAMVACFINLLNLLPVMPFDGGHVLKSVCQSLGAHMVKPALVFISVLIFVVAAVWQVPLLIAPALAALLGMKEMSLPLPDLADMRASGIAVTTASFLGVAGIYLWFSLVYLDARGFLG
ncbi:MAG TPA: site-2 protease family protein [Aestuariivirgaceae bacterium]|nr:site-2 protease family protein [Aestuariivirgaceae bacterium]